MPIREITGVNDGGDLFLDGTESTVSNSNGIKTIENTTTNKPNEIKTSLNDLQLNDVLLVDSEGTFTNTPLTDVIGSATDLTQGYLGLLTDFYFNGDATETVLTVSDVDTWIDVLIDTNVNGTFDRRPTAMKEADATGLSGDGSSNNPIIFSLEGLDTNAFLNFRASLSFEPDEDEGQLESRLLFNRHSGSSPSSDFAVEEVSLSMFNGANVDYISEPMLSFFVGDTIDTNGPGDAGRCRFQIKSNVAGTLKLRALTWYINK
tara:strand:- start:1053 stop:1838 length:786 start_codon:yes stop_codon:yes gene_type:complete